MLHAYGGYGATPPAPELPPECGDLVDFQERLAKAGCWPGEITAVPDGIQLLGGVACYSEKHGLSINDPAALCAHLRAQTDAPEPKKSGVAAMPAWAWVGIGLVAIGGVLIWRGRST